MAVIGEILSPKSNADKVMLVRKVYFSNNDRVNKGSELIDLETSKTAIILDSTVDGFVEYKVKVGDTVSVADVIICIHDKPFKENLNEIKGKAKNNLGNKVVSTLAEIYIKENNIDITSISKNLITLSDITEVGKGINTLPLVIEMDELKPEVRTIQKPIGLAKQIEIDVLSSVQLNGLMSTISTNVEAFIIKKDDSLFSNASDSYLPIIIYETSKLLKKYPLLNSYFQNNSIYEYTSVNIGLALDIDDGLKVYNIRDADNSNLDMIKDKISEGIYRYLRKDLTIEDVTGSTFTITDLSQYGVSYFVPLINKMQSAILGISAIDEKLNRFSITLSFDHRVTEGKNASKFLSELSKKIKEHGVC
jgi:pyruvate/2-oxoglutarate dehydrogenase complex dihydrolipoamide acyltransferase (E2) component